jgi:hypothetical protein
MAKSKEPERKKMTVSKPSSQAAAASPASAQPPFTPPASLSTTPSTAPGPAPSPSPQSFGSIDCRQIMIHDSAGRPRIMFRMNEHDEPQIEVVDRAGQPKLTFRIDEFQNIRLSACHGKREVVNISIIEALFEFGVSVGHGRPDVALSMSEDTGAVLRFSSKRKRSDATIEIGIDSARRPTMKIASGEAWY